MTDEQAGIVPASQQGAITVREQVNQIAYLMRDVLKEGEHYGRVPGTGKNAKPTLLQPGAEKIALMFALVPKYEIVRAEYGEGHREYEVTCTLTSRNTGEVMGYGVGTCSTLESKYRYRWVGYGESRRREDNPDIADTWNTVLKMAKKRAFVDAVKSTTAASDMFTQDVEDMPAYMFETKGGPRKRASKGPDAGWIDAQVERLAALGYDAAQTREWLAAQWSGGGQAAAQAAADAMAAQADDEPAAVEPDSVDGEEF